MISIDKTLTKAKCLKTIHMNHACIMQDLSHNRSGSHALKNNVAKNFRLLAAAGFAAAICAGFSSSSQAQGMNVTISPGNVPIGIDPNAPPGGGTFTIGSEPITMAYCRPQGHPHLQVNYAILAPGQTVLHRVGVYDRTTGGAMYDSWQMQYVQNSIYPVRYLNAPPSGHYWAPFVEVHTLINNQWRHSSTQFIPVNYRYMYCA